MIHTNLWPAFLSSTVLMDPLTAAAEDRGPTARLYCSDGMTIVGGGGTLLKTDWSHPARPPPTERADINSKRLLAAAHSPAACLRI